MGSLGWTATVLTNSCSICYWMLKPLWMPLTHKLTLILLYLLLWMIACTWLPEFPKRVLDISIGRRTSAQTSWLN